LPVPRVVVDKRCCPSTLPGDAEEEARPHHLQPELVKAGRDCLIDVDMPSVSRQPPPRSGSRAAATRAAAARRNLSYSVGR
jgi:hypothetical protein